MSDKSNIKYSNLSDSKKTCSAPRSFSLRQFVNKHSSKFVNNKVDDKQKLLHDNE